MPEIKWTAEIIKVGIDRFKLEHSHLPTASDFDRCPYLPSARQIQRAYGGLEALRIQLGYEEHNYTKGSLRRARSIAGHIEGTTAEDALEEVLINHFGEPYVHTQKRYYKDHKHRYDFFVYYLDGYMGIDIFTTSRVEYVGPNIRHKIAKYRHVPTSTPIYFVVASASLTTTDVRKGSATARGLADMPHVTVIHLTEFLDHITGLTPLPLPGGIKLALQDIEQI